MLRSTSASVEPTPKPRVGRLVGAALFMSADVSSSSETEVPSASDPVRADVESYAVRKKFWEEVSSSSSSGSSSTTTTRRETKSERSSLIVASDETFAGILPQQRETKSERSSAVISEDVYEVGRYTVTKVSLSEERVRSDSTEIVEKISKSCTSQRTETQEIQEIQQVTQSTATFEETELSRQILTTTTQQITSSQTKEETETTQSFTVQAMTSSLPPAEFLHHSTELSRSERFGLEEHHYSSGDESISMKSEDVETRSALVRDGRQVAKEEFQKGSKTVFKDGQQVFVEQFQYDQREPRGAESVAQTPPDQQPPKALTPTEPPAPEAQDPPVQVNVDWVSEEGPDLSGQDSLKTSSESEEYQPTAAASLGVGMAFVNSAFIGVDHIDLTEETADVSLARAVSPFEVPRLADAYVIGTYGPEFDQAPECDDQDAELPAEDEEEAKAAEQHGTQSAVDEQPPIQLDNYSVEEAESSLVRHDSLDSEDLLTYGSEDEADPLSESSRQHPSLPLEQPEEQPIARVEAERVSSESALTTEEARQMAETLIEEIKAEAPRRAERISPSLDASRSIQAQPEAAGTIEPVVERVQPTTLSTTSSQEEDIRQTLAEVKQSLTAVQQELQEQRREDGHPIEEPSPSEFQIRLGPLTYAPEPAKPTAAPASPAAPAAHDVVSPEKECSLASTVSYKVDESRSSSEQKTSLEETSDFRRASKETTYFSAETTLERRGTSRPASSDVEALISATTAGSSEYETACGTSQLSSRSATSNEFYSAASSVSSVSSVSSRDSMKSLDSECSNPGANDMPSEASETLVASTMEHELERDLTPTDASLDLNMMDNAFKLTDIATDQSVSVDEGSLADLPPVPSTELRSETPSSPFEMVEGEDDGAKEDVSDSSEMETRVSSWVSSNYEDVRRECHSTSQSSVIETEEVRVASLGSSEVRELDVVEEAAEELIAGDDEEDDQLADDAASEQEDPPSDQVSRMKRSVEMTFHPEPKPLRQSPPVSEDSPSQEGPDRGLDYAAEDLAYLSTSTVSDLTSSTVIEAGVMRRFQQDTDEQELVELDSDPEDEDTEERDAEDDDPVATTHDATTLDSHSSSLSITDDQLPGRTTGQGSDASGQAASAAARLVPDITVQNPSPTLDRSFSYSSDAASEAPRPSPLARQQPPPQEEERQDDPGHPDIEEDEGYGVEPADDAAQAPESAEGDYVDDDDAPLVPEPPGSFGDCADRELEFEMAEDELEMQSPQGLVARRIDQSPPPAYAYEMSFERTTEEEDVDLMDPVLEEDLEKQKRWMEMQFEEAEDAAQEVFASCLPSVRPHPLADIEEGKEDEESLNGSDRHMERLKEASLSSTPEFDVLSGRRYFTRGDADDMSIDSLQEFERLEKEMILENLRRQSNGSGSQESLNGRRSVGRSSQGDNVSVNSLTEFERLERDLSDAAKIEERAKMQEAMLSEIEEGHESQVSESDSCETLSEVGRSDHGDTDSDDYEQRMFEIDEIIRQAQTNIEKEFDAAVLDDVADLGQAIRPSDASAAPVTRPAATRGFSTGGSTDMTHSSVIEKTESADSADSIEADLAAPVRPASAAFRPTQGRTEIKYSAEETASSYCADSLEYRPSVGDLPSECADSLEVFQTQAQGPSSIDSLESSGAARPAGYRSSTLDPSVRPRDPLSTSADSIEDDPSSRRPGNADTDSLQAMVGAESSSSSSAPEELPRDAALAAASIPPSAAARRLIGGSLDDSLDPSLSASSASRATGFESDSIMSGSVTSTSSAAMISSSETLEPTVEQTVERVISEDGAFYEVRRTVEMQPEIRKITFRGHDVDDQLKQFVTEFAPGEDMQETESTDASGNVHTARVTQRRMLMDASELGPAPPSRQAVETYLRRKSIDDLGQVEEESFEVDDGMGNVQRVTRKRIVAWTQPQHPAAEQSDLLPCSSSSLSSTQSRPLSTSFQTASQVQEQMEPAPLMGMTSSGAGRALRLVTNQSKRRTNTENQTTPLASVQSTTHSDLTLPSVFSVRLRTHT